MKYREFKQCPVCQGGLEFDNKILICADSNISGNLHFHYYPNIGSVWMTLDNIFINCRLKEEWSRIYLTGSKDDAGVDIDFIDFDWDNMWRNIGGWENKVKLLMSFD